MTSIHFCKFCVCHFCERKQQALRRCGPDRNAVSASSITSDTINGKSLLDDLILAFANAPCSHFTTSEPRGGLTTSQAVCSPFPKALFLELFSCIKHFLCCFTPHFQLKSLSLNPHKPILKKCYFFCSFFFSFFSGYIFKAERRE